MLQMQLSQKTSSSMPCQTVKYGFIANLYYSE
jgi:hypothetical protein